VADELKSVKTELAELKSKLKAVEKQLADGKNEKGAPLSAEDIKDLKDEKRSLNNQITSLNNQINELQKKENLLLSQRTGMPLCLSDCMTDCFTVLTLAIVGIYRQRLGSCVGRRHCVTYAFRLHAATYVASRLNSGASISPYNSGQV